MIRFYIENIILLYYIPHPSIWYVLDDSMIVDMWTDCLPQFITCQKKAWRRKISANMVKVNQFAHCNLLGWFSVLSKLMIISFHSTRLDHLERKKKKNKKETSFTVFSLTRFNWSTNKSSKRAYEMNHNKFIGFPRFHWSTTMFIIIVDITFNLFVYKTSAPLFLEQFHHSHANAKCSIVKHQLANRICV